MTGPFPTVPSMSVSSENAFMELKRNNRIMFKEDYDSKVMRMKLIQMLEQRKVVPKVKEVTKHTRLLSQPIYLAKQAMKQKSPQYKSNMSLVAPSSNTKRSLDASGTGVPLVQ